MKKETIAKMMKDEGLHFLMRRCIGSYDEESNKMSKCKRHTEFKRIGKTYIWNDEDGYDSDDETIKIQDQIEKDWNSCVVLSGSKYNTLIIDVDNKGESMPNFFDLVESNDYICDLFLTLSNITMNGGHHFIFFLSDEQKEKLDSAGVRTFKADEEGMSKGLWCDKGVIADVKYGDDGVCTCYADCEDGGVRRCVKFIEDTHVQDISDELVDDIIKYYSKKKPKVEKVKKVEKVVDDDWKPMYEKEDEADSILTPLMVELPESRFKGHDNSLIMMNIIRNVGGSLDFIKSIFTLKKNKGGIDDLADWDSKEFRKYHNFGSLIKILKEEGLYEKMVKDGKIPKKSTPYEMAKEKFEENHFKVMNPIVYCQERDDDVSIKKRIDFQNTYENKLITVETKKGVNDVPFTQLWMKDSSIRTYDRIDFTPNCADPAVYNLYNGLNAEKIKGCDKSDISKILHHMSIMVNHHKESLEYFTAWLAQIIQQPNKLSGTALVFKSKQGAGKNIFIDWFGKEILGKKYYYTTADIETLVGKFAPGFKNKLLVNLDETSGKDTFQNSEKIKNKITCDTTEYEQKGHDKIVLKNYARIIFTTNNDTPVKIEQKDRRLALFECSSEKCIVGDKTGKNPKYFEDLVKSMGDDGVKSGFYHYLNEYDISGYNFIRDRPITELYKDVQKATVPPMAKFLEKIVSSKPEIYGASGLFELYQKFLSKCGFEIKVNITTFGRDLSRYKGIEKKKSSSIKYVINKDELKNDLIEKGFMDELDMIDSEEE